MGKMIGKAFTAWYRAAALLQGWRTRRKIVVIESDDWGSIRMASRQAYDQLAKLGYNMSSSPYNLDALETDQDLEALFEALRSVKDSQGRPACMTANMVMANPDFDRIKESGYSLYFYEPVSATLARDPSRQNVEKLWAQGCKENLFVPQLHAREHVRYWEWMDALRAGSAEALATFPLRMCGVPYSCSREKKSFFSPPYLSDEELAGWGVDIESLVRDGADHFKRQFGFASQSAVAPNYCWTEHVERVWADVGVRYMQGAVFQDLPTASKHRHAPHYLGQRAVTGGIYLVRNCYFEPTSVPADSVGPCLKQVARAFAFHKPAIICSHRVNYIGAIDESNRSRSLKQLTSLLSQICEHWPDVCFMSSVELGQMMDGPEKL